MDVYKIRNQLKSKTIYDIPLRVTFYARVSTDRDEQLNSLENQTKYYQEMIRKNSNWTFVQGYIDEGLSGVTTVKRESFHSMINDAKKGKFDLIITKEITRFARNTLDSIQFTRELLNYGVCVFFQNDNINTVDEDSELRLTIMAGIAQDELRKLSSRVKFGHQQAIKNGVVLGNSRMFGYLKKDKKLIIDETEAPMIRELFELYATDNYSLKQLENIFWDKGYRNHNGNKIQHTTLSNTISNPKYKGYYVGNKVKIIDLFTKKQKFLPPEEWVMYKDKTGEIVPAIVSEELWNRANEILRRRSNEVKNRQNKCNHPNLLTGKLYCTHCNKVYYRKESVYKGSKNSLWICSGKIKNGTNSCPSFSIQESEMKKIIFEAFIQAYKNYDDSKYREEFINLYKSIVNEEDDKSLKEFEIIIKNANNKKFKLLDYNVAGKISDEDFLKMNEQCEKEIAKAQEAIKELAIKEERKKDIKNEIETIRKTLLEATKLANEGDGFEITKSFVNQYIDKIYVTVVEEKSNNATIKLDIKLFSGETVTKLISRTGHICKKMIDAYKTAQ